MHHQVDTQSRHPLPHLSGDNAFDVVVAINHNQVPQAKRPEHHIGALHREGLLYCSRTCVDVRPQVQDLLQHWIVAGWHTFHASSLHSDARKFL